MMLHLQNTLTGSALSDKMQQFAASKGYSLLSTGQTPETKNAEWRIDKATDSQITASSEYNRNHAAKLGRLHSEHKYANWSARTCNDQQWIQLDLDTLSHVWEVAVQGRFNRDQWITRFDIMTSESGKEWRTISENIQGPSGCDDIVYITYEKPNSARYIRIHAREWHNWISMRFDVKASEIEPAQLTIEKKWALENQTMDSLKEISLSELKDIYTDFAGNFSIR